MSSSQIRLSYRVSTTTGGQFPSGLRVNSDVFKSRLLHVADDTVESLQVIWREAGYEDAECQGLLGDLLNKIKTVCAAELAAEHQILEHAKEQVISKIDEYQIYCEQLGRIPDPASNNNCVGGSSCNSYADRLAELDRLILDISGDVNSRMSLINIEIDQIEQTSIDLGENMPEIEQFAGPEGTPLLSDYRLNLMREFNKKLDNKRIKRINEIEKIAKDCYELMNELVLNNEGINNTTDYFEIDYAILEFGDKLKIENGNKLIMNIHTDDLEAITSRFKQLLKEKEKRRTELTAVGTEIARLWTLLRIPTSDRELFQNSFKMNLSLETLSKGKCEVDRLLDIRKQSLGKVIVSIRNDIALLWKEIGIEHDDDKMKEFPMYFEDSEKLHDEAVDIHESYYNKLKSRVEEIRPLLLKISRRESIVQERIELEHIQLNPERLTARGPNAREERKREEGMTTRVRNLEKYTKELTTLINNWELENGSFIYCGERYIDRVTQQEEIYIEIRDSLRNARKKNNGKQEVPQFTPTIISKTASSSIRKASTSSSSLNSSGTFHPPLPPKADKIAKESSYAPLTEANLLGRDEQENIQVINRISDGSDGTEYTRSTEIRERESSATVLASSHRNHY